MTGESQILSDEHYLKITGGMSPSRHLFARAPSRLLCTVYTLVYSKARELHRIQGAADKVNQGPGKEKAP